MITFSSIKIEYKLQAKLQNLLVYHRELHIKNLKSQNANQKCEQRIDNRQQSLDQKTEACSKYSINFRYMSFFNPSPDVSDYFQINDHFYEVNQKQAQTITTDPPIPRQKRNQNESLPKRKKIHKQCDAKNHTKNLGTHLRRFFIEMSEHDGRFETNTAIVKFIQKEEKSYTFLHFTQLYRDDFAFNVSKVFFSGKMSVQAIMTANRMKDRRLIVRNLKSMFVSREPRQFI